MHLQIQLSSLKAQDSALNITIELLNSDTAQAVVSQIGGGLHQFFGDGPAVTRSYS